MNTIAFKSYSEMRLRRSSTLLAVLITPLFALSCSNSSPQAAQTPQAIAAPVVPISPNAFPDAIGHGAASAGGKGGRIIPVTTLSDSGTGSYRACVEAEGPRVCVFRVEGVIRFTRRPPIIRNPYLTIAGQTAPGIGITLTHAGGTNGRTPLVLKGTHDVVVRHIRVRLDRAGGDRRAEDSITIENSHNVLIDHVSASGARDEIINGFADNDNVTISHSIFAYGIPRHDKCALLGSDPTDRQNVSFIGNICAHNGDRNPDVNFPVGSCIEVINNQFYNAQSEFAEVWESEGGTPVSFVGNSFIAGPDTRNRSVGVENDRRGSTGRAEIFLKDNRFLGQFVQISPTARQAISDSPPCSLSIAPASAQIAYETALASAGSYPRDAIDEQVVREIRDRGGRIGYWPRNLAEGSGAQPYEDADRDGMDDGWEQQSGADPERADMWEDTNGDGVSNFEEFLTYREGQLRP